MASRRDPAVLVVVILALLVLLPVLVYLGDAVVLHVRIAASPGRALQTTTVYLATRLKSGKVEIFTDQPLAEVCAHALFPHFGYRPCWYLRRTGFVKIV
jgi:hypothetical protein